MTATRPRVFVVDAQLFLRAAKDGYRRYFRARPSERRQHPDVSAFRHIHAVSLIRLCGLRVCEAYRGRLRQVHSRAAADAHERIRLFRQCLYQRAQRVHIARPRLGKCRVECEEIFLLEYTRELRLSRERLVRDEEGPPPLVLEHAQDVRDAVAREHDARAHGSFPPRFEIYKFFDCFRCVHHICLLT